LSTLKVCIFTETYFPVVGGGETQARLLAEGLAASGFGVIVITRRSDPSLARVERYGDVTVYRLSPAGRQHLKKWGLLLSSLPALFRLRGQYDLILVSGFRVIGMAAVLMSKLLRKKCLLKADNNGEMSGEFFRGGLEKSGWSASAPWFKIVLKLRDPLLRGADGFIAISSQIAKEFSASGVRPASKIHRIPNSVDTTLFRPVSRQEKSELRQRLGIPPKDVLVIYTGRLVSYKGLPLLVQVWEQLHQVHPYAALILVGGGSADIYNCEAWLKDYVRSHGLEESVSFVGEVRNVHEHLQSADIFVFPTEKEAFGISVIEAMACGLPVIATPVGGLGDILVDGQNGLLVSPRDEQELLSALHALISDRKRAESLGSAALQTSRDRYRVEMVTESYIQLFNTLCVKKALPG